MTARVTVFDATTGKFIRYETPLGKPLKKRPKGRLPTTKPAFVVVDDTIKYENNYGRLLSLPIESLTLDEGGGK